MTAASNSEAQNRAAGSAASNPTAPEPTGTLEGAPGADSEALAARDADIDQLCEIFHDAYEAEALSAGWETNPRSRVPWSDVPEANQRCMRAAVRAFLGSSWLADHDRQIAERALDSVIAKWNWNPETHHVGEVHKAIVRDLLDARAGLDGSNR